MNQVRGLGAVPNQGNVGSLPTRVVNDEGGVLVQFPSSAVSDQLLRRAQSEIETLRRALEDAQRRIQRLQSLADRDTLTPLANRRRLVDALTAILAEPQPVAALLYIDLDNLKPINDRYGHLAGDAALLALSRALQAVARPGDCAARIGGDEFALLMAGADLRDAHQLASRFCAMLAATPVVTIDGESLEITASVGAIALSAGMGVNRVLAKADAAMYACKRAQAERSDR